MISLKAIEFHMKTWKHEVYVGGRIDIIETYLLHKPVTFSAKSTFGNSFCPFNV